MHKQEADAKGQPETKFNPNANLEPTSPESLANGAWQSQHLLPVHCSGWPTCSPAGTQRVLVTKIIPSPHGPLKGKFMRRKGGARVSSCHPGEVGLASPEPHLPQFLGFLPGRVALEDVEAERSPTNSRPLVIAFFHLLSILLPFKQSVESV